MKPASTLGRKLDELLPVLFIMPGLACLLLVIAYPLLYNIGISFTDKNIIYEGVSYVGLENFQRTFADRQLPGVVIRSLIWTAGSVSGQLLVGLIAALALDRIWTAQGPIRLLLIVPWAFPTIVMVYAWRFMLDGTFGVINDILLRLGLIDHAVSWASQPAFAMPIVILVAIWAGFPFMMVSIMAAMAAIPRDLYEAARIDGATYWEEVRYITLPFIAPIILSVVLLRTIWTFNSFDLIFLMTGGGPVDATTTLPIYAFNTGWVRYDVGRMASISMIMISILIIVMAAYFWAFRRKAS